MIYAIAVELTQPARNAAAIEAAIRGNFASWTHSVGNVWVVEGPLAADQIDSVLAPLLADADRMLILKCGTEAMWHGVSDDAAQWLAERFPGSLSERVPGKTEGLTP